MHSRNQIKPNNKNWWKILVWFTKINIHHSKNYQKILWPCCNLMGLHELQIIPWCWNIWHHHGNTKQDLLWNINSVIWHFLWLYLTRKTKTKDPQHYNNPKLIWNRYLSERSYNQKHYLGILGNKDKQLGKVSQSTFHSRHILWKYTLQVYAYYCRTVKTNLKSHGGYLNHWVGGLMDITVQTCYNLQ